MKRKIVIAFALLCLGGVGYAESLPGKPVRSSYIGKRWMAFEMNNGPSYKWKKLPDGGSIQIWRSDIAGCCVGRYESGLANRCDLLIRLDSKKKIREIRVLEWGMACNTALR